MNSNDVLAHISRHKMNQQLRFGEVAVLELLMVTNGLDLDYGDIKGTFPK